MTAHPESPENTVQEAPARATLVLVALILVAGVANLNLSVANVALPDIGKHFDSSQTTLDLIAVGYSLGLAASVLYLGALGDRYGRKAMLLLGMALSVPACLLAAFAPSDVVLFVARVIGGLSAGMAYPTTLALIAALWSGPGRTKSIALWSALGGAIASLGPLVAGALLEHFAWGSVFLITLPLVVVAFPMAARFVPGHVNEATEAVDNPGGILSVILVAALILAINFAPVPNKGTLAVGLALVAVAALIGFAIRQRRARNPLYDLHVAGRRIFWVAACAGIIVFGALMGAAFVSQQFLQNVLGYSTLGAGAAFLPTIVFMVLVAPRSAKLVEARGARFTLMCGYVFLVLAFATMLLLWKPGIPYWKIGLAYAFIGIGVGFAGTPASHSLTSSVPVRRAGMASGTADLQRDLGGAIMQSIFGALLTAGYAAAAAAAIAAAPNGQQISDSVHGELTKSFAGAEGVAQQYPQYASQITAAAKQSFLDGDQWAYTAGLVAVLLGAVLVFFLFPAKETEEQLLAAYLAEDTAPGDTGVPRGAAAPSATPAGEASVFRDSRPAH
jgi:DHA2 family multidrug resistance protein-like MFS transporter